jgi:hypothetical protein
MGVESGVIKYPSVAITIVTNIITIDTTPIAFFEKRVIASLDNEYPDADVCLGKIIVVKSIKTIDIVLYFYNH